MTKIRISLSKPSADSECNCLLSIVGGHQVTFIVLSALGLEPPLGSLHGLLIFDARLASPFSAARNVPKESPIGAISFPARRYPST